MNYSLGLDIGISSVGWAVLQNDINGEPNKIINLGSRIFDKAEQPKTGASLALPRREARSSRRRLRRHRHRLERIKHLFERAGIMSAEDIQSMYTNPSFEKSVYELRAEGLNELLNKEEWVRVLIHLAQRRGYKSNSTAEAAKDKETGKVKQAIADNAKRMLEKGYRTIGEMIWKDEQFRQKLPDGTSLLRTRNEPGNYLMTVERSALVSEIRMLFDFQRKFGSSWANAELENEYLNIYESQRSFDEGPGGNSPYKGSQIEKMIGTFKGEPRAAKATFTFEYFKLLCDINKIRLLGNGLPGEPLNPAQREALITLSFKSDKLTYAKIRKELGISEDFYFNTLYYGDKSITEQEKKGWSQLQSYHKIRLALEKAGKDSIKALTPSQLDDIGNILTLYKSDGMRREKLTEAEIPEILHNSLLELSFSKVGRLSLTVMKDMIPYLENGENFDKAYAAVCGEEVKNSGKAKKTRLSLNDMEPITNPVVRRAISQTIKVVNAVVREYGPPEVVRVELAREMGKNFDERKNIEKRQEENRARNERAGMQIEEIKGSRVTGQDIVKFKLWQEQGEICLYSGKHIDIASLYEAGYVDVDHIIPYSQSFDDSYANKVLVFAEENRQKGNRLPYEYFGADEKRWAEFETRVNLLIRDYNKRRKLLKKKVTEEELNAFMKRNLTDTQYITRQVYNLLNDNLACAESVNYKKHIQTVNGVITAYIRKRLGIDKIREDGDLHHAKDAAVIATISPGMIRKITEFSKMAERFYATSKGYYDIETRKYLTKEEFEKKYSPDFPPPWEGFRNELEMRLSDKPSDYLNAYKYPNYDSSEEVRPVFVSRMPNHKVTGAAHMETVRSAGKNGYTVTKTPLSALKMIDGEIDGLYNTYNHKNDIILYNALKERLLAYGGDAQKAFAEPFYKPKADGTPGPLVKKVKITEKSTINVPINHGLAANGAMVRIDIFYVDNEGYYLVPIYVSDTVKANLPNKAIVAHKPYEEWKEMCEKDFKFSLYSGDMINVVSNKGIELALNKGAKGEKRIYRKECLLYYAGTNISSAAMHVTTHDRRYEQISLGSKRLNKIEKYQVDVLGNFHPVTLPEKRLGFGKRRYNGVS